MAPIAKVGGLADVVFGLSRELAIRGNTVEIILPKYDNLRYDHIFGLHQVYQDLWVPWYEGAIHCTVWFGLVHDRKCYFIEPHSQDNFFNRGAVYGFNDDVLRFAFFSRAAMEFLWKAGKHPDIIHCHDWQTALVPVLLFEMFQRLGMTHPRVCLTIHNFAHQGLTSPRSCAPPGCTSRSATCPRSGCATTATSMPSTCSRAASSTPISSLPSRRAMPSRPRTRARASGWSPPCTPTT